METSFPQGFVAKSARDENLFPSTPAWLVSLVFKKNIQQQKGLLSTEFFILSQVKALAKVALPAVFSGVLSLSAMYLFAL